MRNTLVRTFPSTTRTRASREGLDFAISCVAYVAHSVFRSVWLSGKQSSPGDQNADCATDDQQTLANEHNKLIGVPRRASRSRSAGPRFAPATHSRNTPTRISRQIRHRALQRDSCGATSLFMASPQAPSRLALVHRPPRPGARPGARRSLFRSQHRSRRSSPLSPPAETGAEPRSAHRHA